MDELIRKQDALDAIHCDITVTGRQNAELVAATIGAFVDRIKALPPVQPKRGKWIDTETSYSDDVQQKCQCSVCARLSPRPLGDFCRWCGADMRGYHDE